LSERGWSAKRRDGEYDSAQQELAE
jgi:hypothetical protein